jgi:hypothetical protein
MTLNEELSKSDKNWLLQWSLWPAGLYLLGVFLSIYSVIFLPLTLTIAQYYLLDSRSGNRRPTLWFSIVLVYGLIFWCMTKLPLWMRQGDFIWLFYYYFCQCVAEVVLFFMFTSWRWAWYTGFNLLACSIWLIAFKLNQGSQYPIYSDLWLYLLIPAIASLTNAATGYGLLKATETTGE